MGRLMGLACGVVLESGYFDGMGGMVPNRTCGAPAVAVWARAWRHDEVPMCRAHDRRAMAIQMRRDPRTAGSNRTPIEDAPQGPSGATGAPEAPVAA